MKNTQATQPTKRKRYAPQRFRKAIHAATAAATSCKPETEERRAYESTGRGDSLDARIAAFRSQTFNTRNFELSHGGAPRGVGSWAFVAAEHADRLDYLDFVFWHRGSFSDAKRAAAKHFRALNVSNVVVLS